MTDFIRNHLLTPVNVSEKNTIPKNSPQADFDELLTQAMDTNTSERNLKTSLTDNTSFSMEEAGLVAPSSLPMNHSTEHGLQAYQKTGTMQDPTVADAALESNIETGNADNNQYDAYIQEASDKHKVDPNLIHSIIKMESNYNADTKSHAGAAGLMQLMPDTAKSLGVSDISDAKQNIEGGVRYFKNMLNEHNGDIPLALAAYNAGPGNVKKHGGIPPFQETEQYVHKVMDHYNTLST